MRLGQRVVCVNGNFDGLSGVYRQIPIEGNVYTVRRVNADGSVLLDDVDNMTEAPMGELLEPGFPAWRFSRYECG